MLSVTQAAVNRRTEWNGAFIILFLVIGGIFATMTIALLIVRPEGFRTVGLSIIGGAAVGIVMALVITLKQLDEMQQRRNRSQLELEANRFEFWKTFRQNALLLTLMFAWFGLFLGLVAGLAGE